MVLSRQLDMSHLISAYQDATRQPHGYLIVDLSPHTPDELRLRLNTRVCLFSYSVEIIAGKKLLRTLRRLQHERDPEKRTEIFELVRKALMKWFLDGAKNSLKRVIPINKQTQRFINKHQEDLSNIANKKVNEDNRIKAILKRGGAGFVRGVIIRHLLKWNLAKTRTAKPPKRRLKSVEINPKAPKTSKSPSGCLT